MRTGCDVCNIAAIKFYHVKGKLVCRHCRSDFKEKGHFRRERVYIDYLAAVKILLGLVNPKKCPYCRQDKSFDEVRRKFFCEGCNVWLEEPSQRKMRKF